MKLIIQTSPVNKSILTVVSGNNVISTTEVYGGDIIKNIDLIFKERYIEAVQFTEINDYSKKFEKYIEDSYQGVEIL